MVVCDILQKVIRRLGCPDFLLSDNGTEWENARIRQLCKGLDSNILKSRTTMCASQTYGCAETNSPYLEFRAGKVVKSHQTTWLHHIPFLMNAYNIPPHAATGYSPFFLFGRT